jgi:small-conductance mechanosensitive channel
MFVNSDKIFVGSRTVKLYCMLQSQERETNDMTRDCSCTATPLYLRCRMAGILFVVNTLFLVLASTRVRAFSTVRTGRAVRWNQPHGEDIRNKCPTTQASTANGRLSPVPNKVASPASRYTKMASTQLHTILHPAMTEAAVDGIFYHHHNAHHVTLAGSLWPTLQKLHIGPQKLKAIWTNVVHITDWKGLAVLTLLAFGITPVAKYMYHRMNQRYLQQLRLQEEEASREMNGEIGGADDRSFFLSTAEDDDDAMAAQLGAKSGMRSMRQMKRFGTVAFIDQVAKVALSVYAVDVLSIMFSTIGFGFPKKWRISEVYAKLACTCADCLFLPAGFVAMKRLVSHIRSFARSTFCYLVTDSAWGVQRLLRYKTLALCRLFRVDEENMGRIEIVDRLLNGIIGGISALVVLDWMDIKMNNAMTGLFAFGSAGTLAVTLASQGLVTQLLSGIFLMFSDKMYVGDSVVFGDGTSGKVMKLGWMETSLRDSNNIVTRVPNTLLSSQKVSNLSRIKQSQVKQNLRFHYKDATVLPQLLEDIKTEIRKACPRLITDNSRPFRAVWTDYSEDHLEVMIDTHFNIPPYSDAYWTNRQNVLMAITRAITNYNASLVPKQSDMVLRTDGVTVADTKPNGSSLDKMQKTEVPPVVMSMSDATDESDAALA